MGVIGQLISMFSKGPAIQNLENIDMAVKMKDGEILLPIICSKHLDNSDESLNLLKTKIDNYVKSLELPEFKNEFPKRDYILIELNCIKKPEKRILDELELLNKKFEGTYINFSWKS